ncbi:MAG: hypothetical protein WBA97_24320 [Actinophytocola sp.]|uniref:hypothetical protein n=1 Tax=Actinophytocola sp. TaxID=1872138 RepID=UPI003C76B310
MDRDPSMAGTRLGLPLRGFVDLTSVLLAAGALTTLVGLRSTGPQPGVPANTFERSPVRRRMALVKAAVPATYLPGVFPGLALPGMLDGRGVSGPGRRWPFVLEMPMLMALAVHLLRVTVSAARERWVPARAEVAG